MAIARFVGATMPGISKSTMATITTMARTTVAVTAATSSFTPTPLAANVYVSEGRNASVVSRLRDAVQTRDHVARLAHVFVDDAYNRTGFTIVSSSVDGLVRGAMAVSTLALELVDLTKHAATHPRLGVVDHVSCHPLMGDDATRDAAVAARDAIGEALGAYVPTYTYGIGRGVDLATVRRRFGYFRANGAGEQWKGSDAVWREALRGSPPDFGGGASLRDSWGIACVGCVPFVVNHNVVLDTGDVELAKRLARAVSERGGGLAGVQAMGLAYGRGQVEVACNLLDSGVNGPDEVDAFLARAVEGEGEGDDVRIVRSYQTGKSVDELRAMLV